MLLNIIFILLFLTAPAGVLWLCRKVKAFGKIGPVLLLYILGLIVGNIGIKPNGMVTIQDLMSSAMVPIAIPLMLFSCTFNLKETKGQLMTLITAVVAVALSVIAGYFIFGKNIAGGEKIGAMLTGVYTGGTINLASLKTMLDVPEETFILLNSYDMIVSFLYLMFLLSIGIRIFRKWLPNTSAADDMGEVAIQTTENQNPYKGMFTRNGLKDLGIQLGIAAAIIGVSAGLGLLAGDAFMTVFILTLTTLSIAASFLKCLKGRKYGYDTGMYCIYIFSMVVASMADIRSIDIAGELNTIGYLALVIFCSLFLQVLMAKIFRLDADTTIISSVAFICSPPFVPMIAGAMKNKKILAAGLAIGVFGYAAGNYLGFLMFRLLS